MGRKRNPHKNPISNKNRVRMHRQRNRIKRALRERESLLNVEQTPNPQNENTRVENENNAESKLKTDLRDWASKHRISKHAIDDLLAILNSKRSFAIECLPKNHRTLQKTQTNIEIKENVAGGCYWHNGLEKCLMQIFSNLDRDIKISLNFNIDGLPLYKSSTIEFYPILAAIHGMYAYYDVFPIASAIKKCSRSIANLLQNMY